MMGIYQKGYGLIEVLVSVLVLSIGLLGLAGLQTQSLRFNNEAYFRTQATLLAMDMSDRLRTNFETARTNTFLKAFNNLMEKGILLIVVKAECSYLKPVTLTDSVYVEFEITSKGKTSFVIEYEINNGKSVTFATASTTMVCLDKNTGKPIKFPDELEEYVKVAD